MGQLTATAWMEDREQTRMVVSAMLHEAETNRKETTHTSPNQKRLKHKPWILAVQPAQTDDPTIFGESSLCTTEQQLPGAVYAKTQRSVTKPARVRKHWIRTPWLAPIVALTRFEQSSPCTTMQHPPWAIQHGSDL